MILARALGAVAIVGFLGYPALDQGQTGQAEFTPQDLEFAQEAAAMLLHVRLSRIILGLSRRGTLELLGIPSLPPWAMSDLRDVCGRQALNGRRVHAYPPNQIDC